MVVEPGIRPSAHLLSALRRGLMHRGLKPLAPCPHTEPCPMSGRGYTAWCHFNFDAEAAPGWLKKLSDEAKLPKDNVSLSFLHFSAKGRKLAAGEGKSLVRAVSGPFELPAPDGMAPHRFGQYACSERGLTLLSLPKKHLVPMSGTLLEAPWPEYPETDAKSHALILPLGGDVPMPAMRPAPEGEQAHAPARKPGVAAKPAQGPRAFQADRPAKADDRADKFNRPAKPGASGKPAKPGTPAKALTVDSIIAAEEAGAPAPAPKRKRLPSERPADPVKSTGKPAKPAGRPAHAPSGSAPAKGKADSKPKDKPHASRAERKAAGSASGKPTDKSSGKPKGKPAGKKPAKPKGKA
jgi:hypothetical protein